MIVETSKNKLIFSWQDIVEATKEYIQDNSLTSIGLSENLYYKLCEIIPLSKNFYSFTYDIRQGLIYNNYPVYLDSSLNTNEITVRFTIKTLKKCIEINREEFPFK